MNNLILSNGVEIPQIGLGTWQITDREQMQGVFDAAFDAGYRLFDTAAAYSNEIALSRAIRNKGVKRQDLFISDKVWNTSRGHDQVIDACKRSLKKMKTDYFDLYLIHWPASQKLYPNWRDINADTWFGMEELYQEGLVRAIGVCNFKMHHLLELEKTADALPMVNQIELHPGMPQSETVGFCNEHQIIIEASSPLGNGQILTNPVLQRIADRHSCTSAQVCLKWSLQRNNVVIPKTVSRERLAENIFPLDFELVDSELGEIDRLSYCGGIGIDPDEVTEFG